MLVDCGGWKMRRTVIVFTDLFFVLAFGVNEDIRNETQEHVFEELGSEVERSPVMSLLHNVENITLKNR